MPASGLNHKHTHTPKMREERDFKKKKSLSQYSKDCPAKRPLVSMCVQGVWGGDGRGGGKSAEWILRLFAAQRKHSFKSKKKTVKLMMLKEEQPI